MPTFKEVIDRIQKTAAQTYQGEPSRIERDARTTQSAIQDHIGRWLWELLQNCDDSEASKVFIAASREEKACFVADNGRGFRAESIESIRGAHFSDKKGGGTIGRKGVGFKAVYHLTQSPKIVLVDGEGVEFNPDRCQQWMKQKSFKSKYNPYHWIPFLIRWDELVKCFPSLQQLSGEYKTVVILPYKEEGIHQDVVKELEELQPHFMLTFRHLQSIHIVTDGRLRQLTISPKQGATNAHWGERTITDSGQQTTFRVMEQLIASKDIPKEHLKNLDEDSKNFILQGGVSLLVAAPVKERNVNPFENYPSIHVFYPTKQPSPVPLLLHAEFLVKSDRTALLPIENTPLNNWIAQQLAKLVVNFVDNAYSREIPSHYLTLLTPNQRMDDDAECIWEYIKSEARQSLKLPDCKGQKRLPLQSAIFISGSCTDHKRAREILEGTNYKKELVHATVDSNARAMATLRALEVQAMNDEEVISCIRKHAPQKASDYEWLWVCWQWVSRWLQKDYWGRREEVRTIPLIPVNGQVYSYKDLEKVVFALPGKGSDDLPDWLPLYIVDTGFAEKLANASNNEEQLVNALKLEAFCDDKLIKALEQAISDYWENEHDHDHYRFIRFILERAKLHGWQADLSKLGDCPVPAYEVTNPRETRPVPAQWVYFGEEWGNGELEEFYKESSNVYFLRADEFLRGINDEKERERIKDFLQRIGVKPFPIVAYRWVDASEVGQQKECSDEWREYFKNQQRDSTRYEKVQIMYLDGVEIEKLEYDRSIYLTMIVAKNWNSYYANNSRSEYKYFYYSPQIKNIDACWWYDLRHKLCLPLKGRYWRNKRIPLSRCWLPDQETEKTLGDFLPVIDLSQFGDEQTQREIRDWLIREVGVRTQRTELTEDDWYQIIAHHLPAQVSEEKANQSEECRKQAYNCYKAFLDWAQDKQKVDQKFKKCKFLCRYQGQYTYKNSDKCVIYFDDDHKRTQHFMDTICVFDLPSNYRSIAEKHFGIVPVSKAIKREIIYSDQRKPLDERYREQVNRVLPYIYAVRCHEAPKNAEETLKKLKNLEFYIEDSLGERLSLEGYTKEVSDIEWACEEIKQNGKILIYLRQAQEHSIASAIAEALGVPTQADFYENLLRTQGEEDIKKRLFEKGLNPSDVEDALNRWRDNEQLEHIGSEQQERTSESLASTDTIQNWSEELLSSSAKPGEVSVRHTHESKPIGGTTVGGSLRGGGEASPQSETPASGRDKGGELRLVDPENCSYDVKYGGSENLPPKEFSDYGTRVSDAPSPFHLTPEQRALVEQTGRQLVLRYLREQGYEVEEQPTSQPGYDILAKKEGQEYHIEVKAHIRKAGTVTLTMREYNEYASQQGYRWQLWNVEDLEAGKTPMITIYTHIPIEALEAQSLKVNLRRCLGLSADEREKAP